MNQFLKLNPKVKVIFDNRIEPTQHQLERKAQSEKYVWYCAYDEMLSKTNLLKVISEEPIETVSIALSQFDSILSKYNNDIRMFLKREPVFLLL